MCVTCNPKFDLGGFAHPARHQSAKLSFFGRFCSLILLCTMAAFAAPTQALPSYARQTGYACVKCHVGGFGPQLTPYGIRFKISAYTESDHKGVKIPLAMFAM